MQPDWPVNLLIEPRQCDPRQPHLNTSLVLSRGVGLGAPYHRHAPNLFLQVQGRKRWCMFAPGEFTPYLHASMPQPPTQLALVDPLYAERLALPFFVPQPGLPSPIEFVTEPGDMLFITRDWMHATWSLTPYTAVLTLHADNDTPRPAKTNAT